MRIQAGKVFAPIELMDEHRWPMMVLRVKGEPAPFKLNEELIVGKDAILVLGMFLFLM